MDKNSRNHFSVIIYNTLSSMITFFVPFLLIVFSKDKKNTIFYNIKIKIIIIVSLTVMCLIYQLIKWYKNMYSIRENMIFIQSGVFIVKRKEIPFSKIQTINMIEGIMHKLFSTVKLKIDTGNTSSSGSEINIVVNKEIAEGIREHILNAKKHERDVNEDENIKDNLKDEKPGKTIKGYKLSSKELLLSSIVSNSIFAGIAFIGSLFAFFDDYIKGFFNIKIENGYALKHINIKSFPLYYIIIGSILLFILYLIFTIVVSFITNFIKYYKFSVRREESNIVIDYGFFERKSYIIPAKKISAVYLKQNIPAQMLSISSIHIETVGYGDEKGENAVIYPIAGYEKQKEIIKRLLPEFYFEGQMVRPSHKTFLRFIISPMVIPLIISIILGLNFRYGYIAFFISTIFTIKGFLEYRNTGIGRSNELICLINNSFNKVTTIIPSSKIQSISFSSNYFQSRMNISDITVSIPGNIFGNSVSVKNIDNALIKLYEKC